MNKTHSNIDGEIQVYGLEEAIMFILDKKTPPAKTSQEIADILLRPYPTVHPKLKYLHEHGFIEGKKDQTPRPGKKRLLWSKKCEKLNALLQRWKEMVQGE